MLNTSQEGQITGTMIEALRATKPWVRFISIMLFIGAAFILLAAAAFIVFSDHPALVEQAEGLPVKAMGVIYALMSLAYLIPALLLARYASAISRLLYSNENVDMEDALVRQKSFWKFSGIVALIGLILVLVGIVGAIVIPAYQGYVARAEQIQQH